MIGPHLDEDNGEARLAEAAGLTKRGCERLVASWAPRPEPAPRLVRRPASTVPRATDQPLLALVPSDGETSATAPPPTPPPDPRPRVTPLSAERFQLSVTVDAETVALFDELQDLLAHAVPSRDRATILKRALRVLRDTERKRRFGAGAKRRKRQAKKRRTGMPRGMSRRHVPKDVVRHVYERDEGRCTFVDGAGNRCGERALLELDHIVTRYDGGDDSVENLRLRCRCHNQLEARRRFGAEHMARFDGSEPRAKADARG